MTKKYLDDLRAQYDNAKQCWELAQYIDSTARMLEKRAYFEIRMKDLKHRIDERVRSMEEVL